MTPTSVRMVLVEGEKADGLTVDHDAFNVGSGGDSATASAQVVTAILGTRESAAEGGHRLMSTGVTWRDHDEAAALRDALAAHNIDDVMLVSELHAAGALAQAAGHAMGYERTALMFLEQDTATMSVVQTVDGSIVKVQSQDLHTDDAVAELTAMVADLETLDQPPQGVFVVGSGVSVAAIKLQLESATSLPVIAPEEAELALARGAALASAAAPRFEATTVGLGVAAAAADATQLAGAGYMLPAGLQSAGALAYSEVSDDIEVPELPGLVDAADGDESAGQSARRPFLLVGSAMTSIFVIGVAALVISLAVSIRPTVDQRPTPGESMVVPPRPPAAAPAPEPVAEPPKPVAPIETIKAPRPVVQEAPAPRTVFVERAPAPAAPAPAPAAPPPPPPPAAPAPPPPPPAVVPAPVVPPPVIVLPESIVPPLLRPRWDPPRDYPPRYSPPRYDPPRYTPPRDYPPRYDPPKYDPPKYDPPRNNPPRWEPPKWEPPKWEPPKWEPPKWEPPKVVEQPKQRWPSGDSGSRGGSDAGSDRGSNRGSDSIWPWPSFGD
ncbi:DUF7159 family protein [[Mycobacterium] wendilense]|uniref:DUF7159 domain-containing protein n=1 Tax=[Mycobacterium] wendilense TaxID=3064284 RepID=A0ABM9MIQ0_9MYCO|nr:hypothetical protein [Mycolicibacterium sp. MU0050]CAJ1586137.1 hypothetical protein MU0050_004106 [Mycolicibacterium sp. MU0050]